MIKVIFLMPNGEKIVAEGFLGENLMTLAKRYNIETIRGTCGGKLSCSTCHLLIKTPDILRKRSEREEDLLYNLAEPFPYDNSRLSCQIILSKDLDGLEVVII